MTIDSGDAADNDDTEGAGWSEVYENQGRPLTAGTLLDSLMIRERAVRDLPVTVELYDGTDQRKPLTVMLVNVTDTPNAAQALTFTVVPSAALQTD